MDQNPIRYNTGKRIEFFTAANAAYLNYALALEKSLRINCAKKLTIFTINCELAEPGNYVKVLHPSEQRMIGKYTEEQAYCMRFRALIYPILLMSHNTWQDVMLYWIDADSIVRKPLNGLVLHSNSCEITAKQKGENEYASGVLGISTRVIPFAQRYRKLVNKDEHWKSDQRNFAEALNTTGMLTVFKPLPETYCDTTFNDDSAIWTAKIKCHNDPKWLKEYEYYLSQ
jgi:hypothetical protein